MPISPQRLPALVAVAITPAAVLLALLLLPISGARDGIARSPFEEGRAAGSHGWLDFSGFYPAELDAGRSFSWMSQSGRVRLVRLDRRDPFELSIWVQPAVTNRPVDLTIAVDGIAVPPQRLAPGSQKIDIAIPPAGSTRAVVSLGVSDALVPGGRDTRSLGLRVDGIALRSVDGRLRIPSASLRAAAIAGLGLGLVVVLTLGVTPLAFGLAAAGGAWFGFLLTFDGAFLGPYADRVQVIGLASAVAAAACFAATSRTRPAARWGFRAAAGVVVLLTACKLALFVHPMVTVGDSIFHVHRAQVVQRGEYFFTSITPRPFFEFPYAPGLYVVAGPLWQAFRSDMEHVWLLRSITLAAEALLALALYGVVFANWKNRLAAFLASAITVLLPVGFYTICTSNLTNSFGQSIFGIGVAAVLCSDVRPSRRWMFGIAGAVLVCGGFLSHFSTFSVGLPLLFACAAAVYLGGRGAPRRVALSLLLTLAVATTASIAVYYAHFMPVYTRTAERLLARDGEARERSMVAPATVKATRVGMTVWMEFGAAVLIGAVVAGGLLLRSRAADPLALALAGWAAVVVGFWLLGIVTAVEMRASLAAQPLAAILAGLAIARGAEDGRFARAAAAIAIASIVLHAVSDWTMCLGLERFWLI
jgi:hypothetical protein